MEGPLENLALLQGRPGPLHRAQIRPGALAAAAAAFPTSDLSVEPGEKFAKFTPKFPVASLDQGTASEALTAYRAQSELHGRRGGARPVPPGMLRGQIHSQM